MGLIWSTRLLGSGRISNQTFHIVDWLPTLVKSAGGHVDNDVKIDGLDLWKTLVENEKSTRKIVLHNIDDRRGAAAITVDNWKLIKGTRSNKICMNIF